MYKILIVNDCKNDRIQKIKENNTIEYVKTWNLDEKIRAEEYDFIYIKNDLITEEIKNGILIDYIILPQLLERIAINIDGYLIFINIQILNNLIGNNIEIIEFKNWYEKIIIAIKIQEIITGKTYSNKIPLNISLNKRDILKAKFNMNKVIIRNYAGKNVIRRLKYIIKKKKIQKIFFEKIINNIKNDVKILEKN